MLQGHNSAIMLIILRKKSSINKKIYHMARTAPRALSLQSYWENPRMRAVRVSASRTGKSRSALLRTRARRARARTSPCNAASLEDFVAFKHPRYLQPEKQMQPTY